MIVIIGILSALAYSSLSEVIFTSRAKETAQTMRTFAERALAEGKRQNEIATLNLNQNNIEYHIGTETVSAALSNGFSGSTLVPDCETTGEGGFANFNDGASSKSSIGISKIVAGQTDSETEEGYFVACGAREYCGAAVKVKSKNSFVACIKRGSSAKWEVL